MKNIIIIVGLGVALVVLFGVVKVHTLFYPSATPQGFWAGLSARLTAISKGEFDF